MVRRRPRSLCIISSPATDWRFSPPGTTQDAKRQTVSTLITLSPTHVLPKVPLVTSGFFCVRCRQNGHG